MRWGRIGQGRTRRPVTREAVLVLSNFSPEQINAFWAGVTAVAAVVTGGVAIATLAALRRDSTDRTRPVVSAELLPVVLSHGTSELVIQNVGQSVAKNVNVTFDPPLSRDMGQMTAFLVNRYEKKIPTMGPKRRLSNVYSHWRGDGSHETAEPVPYAFTVKIAYQDSRGRNYEDSYDLTLDALRNETTSSPSNTDEAGMRRRLVNAVEEIARGVRAG